MDYQFRIELLDNIRQATSRIRNDFGRTSTAADDASNSVRGFLTPFRTGLRRTVAQLRRVPNSVNNLNDALRRLESQRDNSFDTREIRQFNREIERTERRINRLRNTQNNSGSGSGFGISGLVKGNLIASGIESGTSVIANSLAGLPELAMQTTALNESIKFSGGEEGEANLAFMENMIDKYSLPLLETRDSFSKLSGAFMDTELAGDGMRNIFEGVSTAARAMNLDNEAIDGTFTALSQMMSKGKVSAEELNGQLGERLPGALGLAAKSMGLTKVELLKMMQQGELMSEDFLPKFAAQLKETFGEQALKSADMLPAKVQKLSNSFNRLKIEAFNALEPLISASLDWANGFMQSIKSVKPMIVGVFNGIMDFIQPITEELFSLGMAIYQGMLPLVNTLRPMLENLNVPIANVIGSLREVFGILTPILTDIVSTFLEAFNGGNELGSAFDGLAQLIRGVGQALGFVFGLLRPLLKGLAWLAGRVVRSFVRVVTVINDLIGRMLEGIFGTINSAFGLIDKMSKKLGGDGMSFRLEMPKIDTDKDLGIPETDKDLGISETDKDLGISETNATTSPTKPTKPTKPTSKAGLSAGTSGVKSDRRITHVNITVGTLANISLNTTNIQESSSKIRQEVEKALLVLLNDANQIAMQ